MSGLGEAGTEPNESGRDSDETDYWGLIRQLTLQLSSDGDETTTWKARAYDLARLSIPDPDGFLEWARRHNHLSFTMAEVITEVQSAPSHDVAHRLLAAILCEILEQNAAFAT